MDEQIKFESIFHRLGIILIDMSESETVSNDWLVYCVQVNSSRFVLTRDSLGIPLSGSVDQYTHSLCSLTQTVMELEVQNT